MVMIRRPSREVEGWESNPDWPLLFWPRRRWLRSMPNEPMNWSPSLDIYETADCFVVRTELPGVKKENIDISVSGNMLTIKGERRAPEVQEYECSEICYGSFSRSITLPQSADCDSISATLESGVLEISVPKRKEAKSTRIEIRSVPPI